MLTLFTIGHSNRPLDAFSGVRHGAEIRCIADVRAFPSSRRWPHVNRAGTARSYSAPVRRVTE